MLKPSRNGAGSLLSDGRNRLKTTHKIDYVKFSEDRLVCLCGWEGWAYNRPDNSDGKHFPTHQKEAPPITEIPNKKRVAA